VKRLKDVSWFVTVLYASLLSVALLIGPAGDAFAQAATPSAGLAAAVEDTDSGYQPIRGVLENTSSGDYWITFQNPGNLIYAGAIGDATTLVTGSSPHFTKADYNELVYGENTSAPTRVFDVGFGLLGGCLGTSATTSAAMRVTLERYRGSAWLEVGSTAASGDEGTATNAFVYVQMSGQTLVELQDGDQLRMRLRCGVIATTTLVGVTGTVGYISASY